MRPAAAEPGATGFEYALGVCAETAGARALCLQLIEVPPGAAAAPHLHDGHETAIYVLEGEVEMRWGEQLEETLVVRAGDFLYIPAGMPHAPRNLSDTSPARAVAARTDPNAQESVVAMPHLS